MKILLGLMFIGCFFSGGSLALEPEAIASTNNFYAFCIDMNEDLVYDGSTNYLCEFNDKSIAQVYKTYKADLYHQELLETELPVKNIESDADGVEVIYKWISPNKFRLTVTANGDNEQYLYYFIQKNSGTIVFQQINTGY